MKLPKVKTNTENNKICIITFERERKISVNDAAVRHIMRLREFGYNLRLSQFLKRFTLHNVVIVMSDKSESLKCRSIVNVYITRANRQMSAIYVVE